MRRTNMFQVTTSVEISCFLSIQIIFFLSAICRDLYMLEISNLNFKYSHFLKSPLDSFKFRVFQVMQNVVFLLFCRINKCSVASQ